MNPLCDAARRDAHIVISSSGVTLELQQRRTQPPNFGFLPRREVLMACMTGGRRPHRAPPIRRRATSPVSLVSRRELRLTVEKYSVHLVLRTSAKIRFHRPPNQNRLRGKSKFNQLYKYARKSAVNSPKHDIPRDRRDITSNSLRGTIRLKFKSSLPEVMFGCKHCPSYYFFNVIYNICMKTTMK